LGKAPSGAEQAAEKGLIPIEKAKKHPSGPEQAAEKLDNKSALLYGPGDR
jgi:hypothetical protein